MEPLARVIARNAMLKPAAPAFIVGDDRLSWSDYALRSDRVAARLTTLGLARGDRVAVLLPDGIDPHVAYVAAEKAGLVIVGIGPRAGVEEIRHLLERTGAAAWLSPAVHRDVDLRVCFEEFRSEGLPLRRHLVVEPGAPLGAGDGAGPAPPLGNGLAIDDLFLLNSTSGTTGLPKCVTHDQRRWLHFHELAVAGAELRGSDVFASAIPTPFGFGLWTAHFTPTLLGSPTVLLETFNAEALIEALERQRVSVLAAVSTQFIMMLNSPALADADLSSLRVLYTGGEAVPYERAAEFEDRTGAAVLQFYGSNETGALSCTTLRDSRESRLRTAGHLIESMSVRLFDAAGNDVTATGKGQPGCRGPLTSQGYYDDEAANAKLYTKDGWMLTGDIASLDADGTLRIIGRTADFIIRGGKNISGTAVERAVSAHPAVALAAAVAMPDPVYGERVCVYVELHAPGRNRPHASAALTLDALVAFLRERQVSVETLPERLVVVDALPRSSGGKVAKGQLRENIRARLSREA